MFVAIDRNVGFVQAMGESKEDCMAKLQAIGEQTDYFRFFYATDRLVKAINELGGDIRIVVVDGVADYPEE